MGKISVARRGPRAVTPIRPGSRFVKPNTPPCAVCSGVFPIGGLPVDCDNCKAMMHETCYWGRVASMAEWLEDLRQLVRDDIPDNDYNYAPGALCPDCRAKAGA